MFFYLCALTCLDRRSGEIKVGRCNCFTWKVLLEEEWLCFLRCPELSGDTTLDRYYDRNFSSRETNLVQVPFNFTVEPLINFAPD